MSSGLGTSTRNIALYWLGGGQVLWRHSAFAECGRVVECGGRVV